MSSSYTVNNPKVYTLPTFTDDSNKTVPLSIQQSNNAIINIIYNFLTTSAPSLTLNLTGPSANSTLFNFNILDNSNTKLTPPTLNVTYNASNIINNQTILPSDVISYSIGPNGTGSSVIGSKDVYNNLVQNYGASGPSLTNVLMTKNQVQTNMPDILYPYLDTPTGNTIGPLPLDNKIVTTSNLASDLSPYLVNGFPLSNINKLVTSYGNANLVSNFFGTLASNPGFVTAVASEVIENNNLTSINIGNNSTISLIESIDLTKNDINIFQTVADYLGYTGGHIVTPGTSGPVNFDNLTLSTSAVVSFIADPFYSGTDPSLLVQGNLLNCAIAPPTSTLNRYGLVKGLVPMNSYIPDISAGATGPFPVFQFFDPNANVIGTTQTTPGATGPYEIYLQNNVGLIAFKSQINKNIKFPCTSYGLINDTPVTNLSSNTIPSDTAPPSIINAMLPLYTELAVAAGLVFESEFAQLESEVNSLNNGIGKLQSVLNYLQAYSENIHIVGQYTSVISINGNAIPIGYSYYNGLTSTAPASWSASYYTPSPVTFNSNGVVPASSATEADFQGSNSSSGIAGTVIYPIINTIVIPFSYKGFGYITSSTSGNSCAHPQFGLSINLNNIYYADENNIIPPLPYSNGLQMQSGTQIKIYNESNSIVQLTSRNIFYSGEPPTPVRPNPIGGVPQPPVIPTTPNILPVPAFPFTLFNPIAPPPDSSNPKPISWPTTQSYQNPVSPPLGSSTVNSINLRDTTSDIIYIKPTDSITLVFSQNASGVGGSWGYL